MPALRTTIRIDEDLYRRAKARAAADGHTVSEVIEDAVREALRPRRRAGAGMAPLPTFNGELGTQPGVDLSDAGALAELMDEGLPLDALR
jgi:Ribbon-helix-helix protein, copG family